MAFVRTVAGHAGAGRGASLRPRTGSGRARATGATLAAGALGDHRSHLVARGGTAIGANRRLVAARPRSVARPIQTARIGRCRTRPMRVRLARNHGQARARRARIMSIQSGRAGATVGALLVAADAIRNDPGCALVLAPLGGHGAVGLLGDTQAGHGVAVSGRPIALVLGRARPLAAGRRALVGRTVFGLARHARALAVAFGRGRELAAIVAARGHATRLTFSHLATGACAVAIAVIAAGFCRTGGGLVSAGLVGIIPKRDRCASSIGLACHLIGASVASSAFLVATETIDAQGVRAILVF